MDEQGGQLLARIIGAVGTPFFAERASQAVCAFSDFALGSVILHGADAPPRLLFEDLTSAGGRTGIENYLRFTSRANPVLARTRADGTFRASDFRQDQKALQGDLQDHLVLAPEEELGFRTIGWPAQLEELGLYFGACGGIVEFSLYREKGRRPAPSQTLRFLDVMRIPLAAAFERHATLTQHRAAHVLAPLSAREGEVARLLLDGCSSEAIALRLGITRYTVKDHRKEIFRKLRIGSLAELFALASA